MSPLSLHVPIWSNPQDWLNQSRTLFLLFILDIGYLLVSPISILLIFSWILPFCLISWEWSFIYVDFIWLLDSGFCSLLGGSLYCSPCCPCSPAGPRVLQHFACITVCWFRSVFSFWGRRTSGTQGIEENFEQNFEANGVCMCFFHEYWGSRETLKLETVRHVLESLQVF